MPPVYLAGHAHISACGIAQAGAQAVLAGQVSCAQRLIEGEQLPYYRLPLSGSWSERTDAALDHCHQQLRNTDRATPILVGSSSFQLGATEATLEALSAAGGTLPKAAELPIDIVRPSAFAQHIAQALGSDQTPWIFSSACTSAMTALSAALPMLQEGLHTQALIVATELDNQLSASGFHSLGLLSRTRPQPFAPSRDGLVLGEAVAALRIQTQRPTHLPQVWRIAACEMALDSHSLTGIDPTGAVVARVMQQALAQAQLRPEQIDLLKLHAAGVEGTDLAEARALHTVFGARMPALLTLKPWIGHTQGASALVELAILLDCLALGQVPGHPLPAFDPEIGLQLSAQPQTMRPRHILLNSIGFGGSIACLILTREDA
jgi:3-oxoacyl-[acyl-carrier-protein] synthase-1